MALDININKAEFSLNCFSLAACVFYVVVCQVDGSLLVYQFIDFLASQCYYFVENTSLAELGALAQCLQCRTVFKT